MKFINQVHITPHHSGYYINPFELSEPSDQKALRRILDTIFMHDQTLFLICHTDDEIYLDVQLQLDLTTTEGAMVGPKVQLESGGTGFCISVKYNSRPTLKLIVALWRKFTHLRFFAPLPDVKWSNLISYHANLFQSDRDGLRMFIFDFAECIFIKGAGGESLLINYKSQFLMPNIKDILLGR